MIRKSLFCQVFAIAIFIANGCGNNITPPSYYLKVTLTVLDSNSQPLPNVTVEMLGANPLPILGGTTDNKGQVELDMLTPNDVPASPVVLTIKDQSQNVLYQQPYTKPLAPPNFSDTVQLAPKVPASVQVLFTTVFSFGPGTPPRPAPADIIVKDQSGNQVAHGLSQQNPNTGNFEVLLPPTGGLQAGQQYTSVANFFQFGKTKTDTLTPTVDPINPGAPYPWTVVGSPTSTDSPGIRSVPRVELP